MTPTADTRNYAVFLFAQAREALGDAIKAYSGIAPVGQPVVCVGIDASGALFPDDPAGANASGPAVKLQRCDGAADRVAARRS